MSENITHIYDINVTQPYAGYVEKRSEKIGEVLTGLMPDQHIVLCSRHITPQELQPYTPAITYGVVVGDLSLGHKDTLYKLNTPGTFDKTGSGIATDRIPCLEAYCKVQLYFGNSVRIKDPTASDSNGQIVVSSLEELDRAVGTLGITNKLVAMPNLTEITDRLSIGVINLGKFGTFAYFGKEYATTHNGRECYGGTEIALFRQGDEDAKELALDALKIDPVIANLGLEAIRRYAEAEEVLDLGRASVDVIVGVTDNGDPFSGVVDLTARAGGVTPAEVLAMEALASNDGASVVLAQSILWYNPHPSDKPTGTIFVDSTELRITAEVTGTL